MADRSVNHFDVLINKQIDDQENLSECLSKADALARITLSNDFFDCSDDIKHYYLWALSDIIEHAKTIHEDILNVLFKKNKMGNQNFL